MCSREDDPTGRDNVVAITEEEAQQLSDLLRGRMRVAAMHANADAEQKEADRAALSRRAFLFMAALVVVLGSWLFVASLILVFGGN
jgi:hypothetical protein